jgi:hypothetical protein
MIYSPSSNQPTLPGDWGWKSCQETSFSASAGLLGPGQLAAHKFAPALAGVLLPPAERKTILNMLGLGKMTEIWFYATHTFSSRTAAGWEDFIGWSGLAHLARVLSLDIMLCPPLVSELIPVDWEHNVHADFRSLYFRHLDYLVGRLPPTGLRNLLAILLRPQAFSRLPLPGRALRLARLRPGRKGDWHQRLNQLRRVRSGFAGQRFIRGRPDRRLRAQPGSAAPAALVLPRPASRQLRAVSGLGNAGLNSILATPRLIVYNPGTYRPAAIAGQSADRAPCQGPARSALRCSPWKETRQRDSP